MRLESPCRIDYLGFRCYFRLECKQWTSLTCDHLKGAGNRHGLLKESEQTPPTYGSNIRGTSPQKHSLQRDTGFHQWELLTNKCAESLKSWKLNVPLFPHLLTICVTIFFLFKSLHFNVYLLFSPTLSFVVGAWPMWEFTNKVGKSKRRKSKPHINSPHTDISISVAFLSNTFYDQMYLQCQGLSDV